MRIEVITYKRIKSLGNYESETMELTASLEEEDLPEDVAENLKLFVHSQLYPPMPVIADQTSGTPENF